MSWTSPDVAARRRPGGERGVYALANVPEGRVVGVFDGRVEVFAVAGGRVDYRGWGDGHMVLQVALEDDRLYGLVPLEDGPTGIDFINHSCRPNCVVGHGFVIKAQRQLHIGEELTINYHPLDIVPAGKSCWCEGVPEEQRCRL